MKKSTQKILTRLYSRENITEIYTNYDQLQLLLPELSASGIRSAVSLLKNKGLVSTDRIHQQSVIYGTRAGSKTLESQIPAFYFADGAEHGMWSCLVFLTAPKQDSQFRYLRRLLLDHNAVCLTRGVYLYPGEFPARIRQECHQLYTLSVVIFRISSWDQGDARTLVTRQHAVTDLLQSYSGISSEIDDLLNKQKQYSDLNDQQKRHIFSVFNRLFEILSVDPGLMSLLFPQEKSGLVLLNQIQLLLQPNI